MFVNSIASYIFYKIVIEVSSTDKKYIIKYIIYHGTKHVRETCILSYFFLLRIILQYSERAKENENKNNYKVKRAKRIYV